MPIASPESRFLYPFACALLVGLSLPAMAETFTYTVIFGGVNVGHLTAEVKGDQTTIDYNVKNNGRGPTIAETIKLDADGLPTEWRIDGATTFGSKVTERFARHGARAEWVDSTGKGHADVRTPSLYVGQSASPWADGLYARALLKVAGRQLPAFPGGVLHLEKGETLTVQGSGGPVEVTRYDLLGLDLQPDTILLDPKGNLFASVDSSSILVRAGYEGEEQRLRGLASTWSTERLVNI